MDAFLTAFWPNAAATIVGVVLGLPIALWINRLALKNAEQSNLALKVQRLDHALTVLVAAMESNLLLLESYASILADSKVTWHLNLDVSAWEAIKDDFAAELTDPDLRRQLAFHFRELNSLLSLNAEYLGFSFGTNASMSGSEQVKASIKANMQSMCEELQRQATQIIDLSKSAQQSSAH